MKKQKIQMLVVVILLVTETESVQTTETTEK